MIFVKQMFLKKVIKILIFCEEMKIGFNSILKIRV